MKKKGNEKTIIDVLRRNHPEYEDISEFGVPRPETVVNLGSAAKMIKWAIKNNMPIQVFSDYDVDGVMSAANMKILLDALKYDNYNIRFTRRFTDGYGGCINAVNDTKEGLFITLDNGISANEEIKVAKEKGLYVLIIDHHRPTNETLPPADVIVNPNAIEGGSFNHYCGAGLVYKLAEMMLKTKTALMRARANAAIATIADVVPLTGDNYVIAKHGLKDILTNCRTSGLKALMETYNCDEMCFDKDISYSIVPALNACGRLYDNGAQMAFDLVTFDGPVPVAKNMAEKLKEVNEERKKVTSLGIKAVTDIIEREGIKSVKPVVVYAPNIHEGVVGIVAGHIAEEFKSPAFIMTNTPSGIKGSARSYGEVDLKELYLTCPELFARYGGHKKAAGFSIIPGNVEKIRDAMAKSFIEEDVVEEGFDLEIEEEEIPTLIKQVVEHGPYGEGNPPIVFKVNYKAQAMYDGFYSLVGQTRNVLKFKGKNSTAIGFNMAEKYLKMGTITKSNNAGTLPADLPLNMQDEIVKNFGNKAVSITNLPLAFSLYGTLGINHFKNNRTGQQMVSDQVEFFDLVAERNE